jgi:transcriptional regulator with XRE-family HTH domain
VTILTLGYPRDMDLKTWVRAERERRGWTQDELAAQAGIDRVEVNAVENGRNKGTSSRIRDGLTKAFGKAPPSARGIEYEPGQNPSLRAAALGQRADWAAARNEAEALFPSGLDIEVLDRLARQEFTGAPDQLTGAWVRLMHDAMKIGDARKAAKR